jgi:polygalacturonase
MKATRPSPRFLAAAALTASCFLAVPLHAVVDVTAAANVHPALPVIPNRTFLLTDFGAVGDGKTFNTEAFKKAVAAVDQAGGGKLVVPKGVFRTHNVKLCSNLDLHLDAGAVILAPDNFKDYGLPDPATIRTQDEIEKNIKRTTPLITGEKLHDVALTGEGTIDGNGALWWTWSERAARRAKPQDRVFFHRPNMVALNGIERLHVADVTLVNSPRYNLVPRDVTDLTVERIKIRAPADSPNTDGIDPGPVTNCLIRDCDISNGDDDIAMKFGGTNILIENMTVHRGHGISIGSSTNVGFHNMLVRHCTFDGTDFGIRIKSSRGRGGEVENVRYTDIQMKNVRDAITMYSDYINGNDPDFVGQAGLIPFFHNILVDHVTVTSAKTAGRIAGLPESRITDITFQDVAITAERDFEIKDADHPVYDNVTLNIHP